MTTLKTLNVASLALCLGGLLSGCTAAERAMPGTLSDANVVSVLDAINVSEIEAAQLAKQKASNAAVRAYAARLVDEHTAKMQQPCNSRTAEDSSRRSRAWPLPWKALTKRPWMNYEKNRGGTSIAPISITR